jgi:hypothetical protein
VSAEAKAGGVAGRHEHAGAIGHDLGHAPDAGGDDRPAREHPFDNDATETPPGPTT